MPPPVVLFKGFAESVRNFELIAFVHDAGKLDAVISDLCFEIDDTFRKEGIPFPFPPRNVNLNLNGDQLRQILTARGDNRPSAD